MQDGQPTYDQLYKVIGSIYADAYLRIESLENENRQIREDQQKHAASLKSLMDILRKENEDLTKEVKSLRDNKWNNGNVNSMLPESLQAESRSA